MSASHPIRRRRPWELPESAVTPEAAYLDRRAFLKAMGVAGMAASGLLAGCPAPAAGTGAQGEGGEVPGMPPESATSGLYPARRNAAYGVARDLTAEGVAARYNNFYEFTERKEDVLGLVGPFRTRPWEVEVGGLVEEPRVFDIDDLVRSFELEERVYRFRCVEAWAMTVPWTGFPLRALVEQVKPKPEARYLRFVSFLRPEEARGQKTGMHYPWPYYEGLGLEEATHELTLVATGIYGHELPKQHGAPMRIVCPWKYGYKSPKSIERIEFVAEQPATFWNDLAPDEYSFLSNVEPEVPHPRWSQATERLIGSGERVPTRIYNGYGEQVAQLYRK